nr:TetR/AcrR family transcriptional regulator [Streptococcus catagoni]
MKVFLKKGFSKASMEDIIKETSLSKGGFYHYYKSTDDIMLALFIKGQHYRLDLIDQYLLDHQLTWADLSDPELFSEVIVEKIIDQNELMDLYAIFLSEKRFNPNLNHIYKKLVQESLKDFSQLIPSFASSSKEGRQRQILLTEVINSLILGCHLLEAASLFRENKAYLKEMIKTVLN